MNFICIIIFLDFKLIYFSELSSERENLVRKQNEMSSDIERLLRHNEELFEIREELKKSGLSLYNKKVLNANTTATNKTPTNDPFNEHPKPLMFVSKRVDFKSV